MEQKIFFCQSILTRIFSYQILEGFDPVQFSKLPQILRNQGSALSSQMSFEGKNPLDIVVNSCPGAYLKKKVSGQKPGFILIWVYGEQEIELYMAPSP